MTNQYVQVFVNLLFRNSLIRSGRKLQNGFEFELTEYAYCSSHIKLHKTFQKSCDTFFCDYEIFFIKGRNFQLLEFCGPI